MLKKCFYFVTLFWTTILGPILLLKPKNFLLIFLTQLTTFCFITYPMFCGLLKNKLMLYFNFKTNYFKCVKHSLFLMSIFIVSGIVILVPFILTFKLMPSSVKLTSVFLGGLSLTLWLLFLTNFAFLPFLTEQPLKQSIKLSYTLAKQHKTNIFILFIKTYSSFLLIPYSAWALKNYIVSLTDWYKNLYILNKIKIKYSPNIKNN